MAITVKPEKGTPAITVPALTTGSAVLLAANSSRKKAYIKNDTAVVIYISQVSGFVSATAGYPLAVGETFVDDFSKAAWYARTASSTGSARVMEVS